ncbi:MAG: hypothetical protein KKA60_16100, partial [Proteobacteria bacterium]|nr:hypothetical protein [Pseudomonadota bacterium]
SRGSFVEGRMHGPWTDWYEDGSKAQESLWENGRKAGQWTVYERETGRVKDRPSFDPKKEPPTEFTLLTDRDVTQIVTEIQRVRLHRAWVILVGARVARRVPAWSVGVWMLFFVPIFAVAGPALGLLGVPASAAAAGLLSTATAGLARIHENATRPDAGTAPGHR